MSNKLEFDKDSEPEAKMADHFTKYGDLIVAFVALQSLTFGYMLGKKDELRDAIINGRPTTIWFILGAGFFYSGLIWFCASSEQSLRLAAGHSETVRSAAKAAKWGRIAIIVVASFVAAIGLYLQK